MIARNIQIFILLLPDGVKIPHPPDLHCKHTRVQENLLSKSGNSIVHLTVV